MNRCIPSRPHLKQMLRCMWSRLPAFVSVVCGLTLRVFATLSGLYGYPTIFFFFFGAPSLFSPCSPLVFWCTPAVWFPGAFGLEHKLRWAFMWNPGSNRGWIIQHVCFIHIFVLAILSSMSTLSFWPFFCFVSQNNGNCLNLLWYVDDDFFILVMEIDFRSSRSQTFIIQLLLM